MSFIDDVCTAENREIGDTHHLIDIGSDHILAKFSTKDGRWSGVLVYHRPFTTPKHDMSYMGDNICCGSVTFAGHQEQGQPSWLQIADEPLTLLPSVLCSNCADHGWIRNGKWEKS